jgi:uncharacterized protein (TIGR02099 family)
LEHSVFHRLSSILWGFIVVLIVLLAVYVSVGRMLTSMAGAFQKDILQELNYRVPFLIDARRVSGQWHSFTPFMVLNGLRLTVSGSSGQSIELSQGRVGLDIVGSLRTWTPQMTQLHLEGLALNGELTAEGQLRIKGFEGDTEIREWLENFLLNVEHVSLDGISLALTLPGGEQRRFDLDLQMSREGSYRRIEAKLSSTGGMQIFALAEGLGNPFEPEQFSGDAYLKLGSSDIGSVRGLLAARMPGVLVEGGIELELWSSWDEGKPAAQLRLNGDELLIVAADGSWQLPLDRVAFEASLVERKKNWGLFVSGLELAKDGVTVQVPRVQLDAWGETVRIRATEIPLAPLSAVLAGTDLASTAVADVLHILQPRGSLPALQLSVTDVGAPGEEWGLLANFQDVAVDSWKGAPGVTAASGYLELEAGGGFVVLDSQQFSMDFPSIYREPLYYDDFNGTININWNAEAVSLSSGLVSAQGAEGMARVLFGLNIPLVPSTVGLEMDLLVGLQDSHPVHRAKYVPDVLNQGLREWLAGSIGEGVIDEGAFLWRGSLTPAAASLRTVQLFFNIEDTELSYHPNWPALTNLDGMLLIDDSDVSVWSEHASLFDSDINQLSVETRVNDAGDIMLAVAGGLQGPAADGLAVINGAVIGGYVGHVFEDWRLSGSLATDLKLLMNLTDKSILPQVEVQTRWLDVDLDIQPGNLAIRGIGGDLTYSTGRGFSSSDLAGELWGHPLTARVGQRDPVGVEHGSTSQSTVAIDISTSVDIGDVRQWLNLDMLAFASNQTPVDIEVLVAPTEPPRVVIESALAGLSLDLPSPWNKSTATRMPFRLELQLGGESMLLGLDLDDSVKLNLDLLDGVPRSGALAFAREPAELRLGALQINGHVPQLDVDEWSRFIANYFLGDSNVLPAGESDAGEAAGLAIVIDKVHTDSLLIGGNRLNDVVFSMTTAEGRWQASAETGWLRGSFNLGVDDAPSQLDISYLDLSGLGELQLSGEDPERPLELPDLEVNIAGLYHGVRSLGNIAFDLGSNGGLIYADNITGDFAGMQLLATQPGQLRWRQGEESRTEFQAALHFTDLGQTLTRLGYQKILETDEGRFDLALEWPGGPQDFSLLEGSGSLRVDIEHGRFLDAPSGASGTLRVVSILNLAEMVRRLSLSHMFESGISFDQVDGEVFLHAGTIEVAAMEVQGGASSFAFSGVSEVEGQTLGGELVVTLPVANNLPWVAALTVGLPVAAGVFLLSKVFEEQVDRLTSAVYLTTGTWDDPEVKFDRIFDDSAHVIGPVAAQATAAGQPPERVEPATAGQAGEP